MDFKLLGLNIPGVCSDLLHLSFVSLHPLDRYFQLSDNSIFGTFGMYFKCNITQMSSFLCLAFSHSPILQVSGVRFPTTLKNIFFSLSLNFPKWKAVPSWLNFSLLPSGGLLFPKAPIYTFSVILNT